MLKRGYPRQSPWWTQNAEVYRCVRLKGTAFDSSLQELEHFDSVGSLSLLRPDPAGLHSY